MLVLKNNFTVFLEISTVHPIFVTIKNEQLGKVSVLTRKILPPVFGIATIGWIIGGTIWFDNQSSTNHQNVFSTTSSISSSITNSHIVDSVALNLVENPNGHFQALNLFFQKNKFSFAENNELQVYFKDLQSFLQKNPTVKLKIAAFHSNTEGGKISKKRLTFVRDFLKNKNFNRNQFIFENRKTAAPLTTIADAENIKNQRVEMRIATP
jgi:hypothetical protein